MSAKRIPSLDGMRAVSILMVIAFHLEFIYPTPVIWRVDWGNLGVRVFFVISGFLITSLLLKERDSTGRVSIGAFYLRRAFRILPAYYLLLAAMAVLVGVHLIDGSFRGFLPSILYYANYKSPIHDLKHTWSLSVEEQFYFLWPATIVLLGWRRAAFGCAALLLTAPLFRALSDLGIWHVWVNFGFECASDAIAVGCLLAIFRDRLWERQWYRAAICSPLVSFVAIVPLFVIAAFPFALLVRDVVCLPVLNFGIAALLDRYMRFPDADVGRALNWRPIMWVGTISYSLYLWQTPWIFNTMPLEYKLAGAFACAAISYYLVEQPMLKFRNRIATRATSYQPLVKGAAAG